MNERDSSQTGLVVAGHRNRILVEDKQHNVVSCRTDRTTGAVVVGDAVSWHADGEGRGNIETVLPRRTLLSRSTPGGITRPVAANVDVLVAVFAPLPKFSQRMLDRYLVVAEYSGIAATLVLNKVDLLDDDAQRDTRRQLTIYEDIGYQVHWISTITNQGMDDLQDALQGRLSVLAGQSGVGKSSMLRVLTTQESIEVGGLSARGNMGRHTTSTSKLYRTAANGHIIDTPGVQDFALWHVPQDQLDDCFVDFKPYLGSCRFRDCRHLEEPDCAVEEATKAGKISSVRLQSYRVMRTEERSE
jgi:ribosome biogenesis GTPase